MTGRPRRLPPPPRARPTTAVIVASLVLAAAWMAVSSPAAANDLDEELRARGYTRIVERRGVTVYQSREASTVKLVAEAVLPVPPERLQAVLIDYDAQVGHVERLRVAKVIERSKNRLLVYQRLDLPLISDRDFTLDVRWGGSGDRLWVKYHVAPKGGPAPTADVVRLTHHSGRWQILPGPSAGTSRLRFRVSIDLAGSLPKVLAKAGAGRDVPDLYGALCRLAIGDADVSRSAARTPPTPTGGESCP